MDIKSAEDFAKEMVKAASQVARDPLFWATSRPVITDIGKLNQRIRDDLAKIRSKND